MTRGGHLLDAVLAVLSEHGLAGLSVRTVAAHAGVSPAQVQYYYRTKEELVRAGYEHAGQQFLTDLTGATSVAEVVLRWLPLDTRRERRARVWLAYAAAAAVNPDLGAEAAALDAELRRWFVEAGLTEDGAAQTLAMLDGTTLQCLTLPMAERAALVERTILAFLRDRED